MTYSQDYWCTSVEYNTNGTQYERRKQKLCSDCELTQDTHTLPLWRKYGAFLWVIWQKDTERYHDDMYTFSSSSLAQYNCWLLSTPKISWCNIIRSCIQSRKYTTTLQFRHWNNKSLYAFTAELRGVFYYFYEYKNIREISRIHCIYRTQIAPMRW